LGQFWHCHFALSFGRDAKLGDLTNPATTGLPRDLLSAKRRVWRGMM